MFWIVVYFAVHAVSAGLVSVLCCAWLGLDRRGPAIWLVSAGIFSASLIVFVIQTLGYAGWLNVPMLLFVHCLIVGIAIGFLRWTGFDLQRSLNQLNLSTRTGWAELSQPLRILTLAGTGLVALLLVSSGLAQPFDFDSHGYRLSRIGLWLQEGFIGHSVTTDARMNYSAIHGDLLMLAGTAPFQKGYPLVNLIQGIAGLFFIVSLWGLARLLSFSRESALLAAFFPLGMAFFIGQMTTEQVDLLVAGFVAATLFLLFATLRKGVHPLPGVLALALAIGTKGSMFYFLPGLAVLGLIGLVLEKPPKETIVRTAVLSLSALALLAAPRYLENQLEYGNPFAPRSEIEKLHDDSSVGFAWDKLNLNTRSYGVQLFTEESNPFGLERLVSPLADTLAQGLPEERDPHTVSRARRPWFESFRSSGTPAEYALFGSSGALPVLLMAFGLAFAATNIRGKRGKDAKVLLALFACAVAYHFFFAGMFKWSPFKFRYYLMIVPMVALLAAYPFDFFRGRLRTGLITAVAILLLANGGHFYVSGGWSGLGNFLAREQTQTGYVVRHQNDALREFVPESSRIAVALPYYALLSSFFRTEQGHHSILVLPSKLHSYPSAAAFLDATEFDAVVTRAGFWNETNGNLRGVTWTGFAGENHRDNFEILRTPLPNEAPEPFVRQANVNWESNQRGFLYSWEIGNAVAATGGTIRMLLKNDTGIPWEFAIPEISTEQVAPGQTTILSLPISPDADVTFWMLPADSRFFSDPEENRLRPKLRAIGFQPLLSDRPAVKRSKETVANDDPGNR